MTRVLITGATGFIGRHVLAPLAERGFEVHAVTSRADDPPSELTAAVAWHRADLLAPDGPAQAVAAAEPSRLLHLAWYADHGKFWASGENLRWVEASMRLLRAFAEIGGRRAVVAGTCAEYDWSHGLLSERRTPLRPDTLYGKAKRRLHQEASELGLSLGWGRVFLLYGPHEDPRRLVASVARALVRGKEAPTSAGTQVRDFLHVADVGAAFATLLASDVTGPVNVASGEPVAIRDVVELLGAAAGRPDLLKIGALPQRESDPPQLVADVARLREEVGWSPRWTLEDGLRETLGWWASAEGLAE